MSARWIKICLDRGLSAERNINKYNLQGMIICPNSAIFNQNDLDGDLSDKGNVKEDFSDRDLSDERDIIQHYTALARQFITDYGKYGI